MRAKGITTALLLVAASLLAPSPAQAATNCTINTTPTAFGAYDVFSAVPRDAAGSVTFRCTGTPLPSITIVLDRGGAPSFVPRLMRSGTESLSYNLYLDAARTVIWGDGTGGTQVLTVPNPPRGQPVAIPVYGRIPPQQDVRGGAYGDTVTATILF